jgi:isoleucyl-tRNA synthetase
VRFILSNLYDFDPEVNTVDDGNLKKIDKWILLAFENVLSGQVIKAYDNFEFYKAYQKIYEFCNIELSSLYLDMAKGRLYTCGADSVERRAAQTAIYKVLNILVRAMAPILTFTAEEIWQNMPRRKSDKPVTSVHLLNFPEMSEYFIPAGPDGKTIPEEFKSVFDIYPLIAKSLEERRSEGVIGSSFDAKIKLLTKSEERYTLLTSLKGDLCEIFKVSQVEIVKDNSYPDIAVEVSKAEGVKCERCWNYSHSVGIDKNHPLICDRCLAAIGGK